MQPSEPPGLEVIREILSIQVFRMGSTVTDLRRCVDGIGTLLERHGVLGEEAELILGETDAGIRDLYDTMVRVRWAALGIPAATETDRARSEAQVQYEGGDMSVSQGTIFVVDDNPSVRKALTRLFRSLYYDVVAYPTAVQFLDERPDAHPACVILDIRMPRMSGLDLQKELASLGSDLPIIFITGHGDVETAVQAMKEGAVDFLPKPFNDQDLIDSVERALRYHRCLRADRLRDQDIREHLADLSPREREVFERVVKGMLNKQIAYDLGTAEKTIKVHRARVMRKMGAESLADLVRMAERIGIEGPADDELL